MGAVIKKGDVLIIPMKKGESIFDANMRPRMYKSRKQLERYIPPQTMEAEGIEVVEFAQRKHGRWIHTAIEDDDWGGTFHKWTCANCDYSTGQNPGGTHYCPNCGAMMDKGVKDG